MKVMSHISVAHLLFVIIIIESRGIHGAIEEKSFR